MAEQIRIVLTSFGRGFFSFIRPWNQHYEPSKTTPGIDKYFARVGQYLSNAEQRFAEEHPEVLDYAN